MKHQSKQAKRKGELKGFILSLISILYSIFDYNRTCVKMRRRKVLLKDLMRVLKFLYPFIRGFKFKSLSLLIVLFKELFIFLMIYAVKIRVSRRGKFKREKEAIQD